MYVDAWIKLVLAERRRILARVEPVPPPPADSEHARSLAIYRAAAALLEWERTFES
jgi:hypothetical protein